MSLRADNAASMCLIDGFRGSGRTAGQHRACAPYPGTWLARHWDG